MISSIDGALSYTGKFFTINNKMKRKKNNEIPDKWRNYSNMGVQVPNTRFLPFKVPLKDDICRRHGENFTPNKLLENQPRLKLIVDLTYVNDGRYYYYETFTNYGVQVIKIKCPGGPNQIPPRNLVKKFYDSVDNFLTSRNNSQDSLIGVHCTHGLNRTGYFICKYMIDRLGIDAQKAIEYFETARGHEMERPLLKNDLLKNSKCSIQSQSPLENCYTDEMPSSSSRYGGRHMRHY